MFQGKEMGKRKLVILSAF